MYLIISQIGFFIGLSRAAAEAKCKLLKVQDGEIITCTSLEDATRCVKAFGANSEPVNISINTVTYWRPIQKVLLVNPNTRESHCCYSDGTVIWKTKEGKEITYKNCQAGLNGPSKTVKLMKKFGSLYAYDFDEKKIIKTTSEGEIWKKAEHDRRWEKVSCP